MASKDQHESTIIHDQPEEHNDSNDEQPKELKDSTEKIPEGQNITEKLPEVQENGREDHWKKWLESRNVKVIVSVDANTTKKGSVETLKWVCKTLVDILPTHTLLCAGKQEGAIDKIISKEFKLKWPNHKSRTINRRDGEKSRDNQTDAKIAGLSIYHHQSRFLFENDEYNQNNKKSSSSKVVYKVFPKTIHKTFVYIIHIDIVEKNAKESSGIENNNEEHYKINIQAEKVSIDELLKRLKQGRMKSNKIKNKMIPMSIENIAMVEDQRCKSIGTSILKCLMKAYNRKTSKEEGRKKEEDMVNIIFNEKLNDKELLKEILNQAFKGKIHTLKFDDVINESWIYNFIEENKSSTSNKCPTSEGSKDHIEMKETVFNDDTVTLRKSKSYRTDDNIMRQDMGKYKVLFIWCVSKGISRNVTMEFWKRGENKVAMALLAYKICKNMKSKYDGSETGRKMSIEMKHYGDLAITLLGQCFCKSERLTFRLLIGRIPLLLDMTPFDIALDAEFETFIAQKPCKMLLDRFWTTPLSNPDKCYYIIFLVSIIFPLLSPFLMRFSEIWIADLFCEDEEEVDDCDEYDFQFEEYGKEYDDDGEDINMISAIVYVQNDDDGGESVPSKLLVVSYFYYKLVQFFLGTQTVRFIYTAMSHMAYLILFSYVMLTEFGKDPSAPEIILDLWTLILWIEEIRQAVREGLDYLDNWNIFDNFGLILFLIGFILRMIAHGSPSICPECLYTARIVLAFSLMIFILRTLQLLSVHSTLGPAIFMINALLKDLVSFMLILAVFVFSYGIGSQIILYPNQPLNIHLFIDIFYDSFWSVLQQFKQDEVIGKDCNTDETTNITAEYCSSTTALDVDYVKCKENKCPANRWIVAILLVIYAIITVVMLLNVLIAMFNTTFSQVHDKKEEVYILQVYRFMREYSLKSVFPVPLCVVSYWRVIPWCIQRYRKQTDQKSERKLFKHVLPAAATRLESKEVEDMGDGIYGTSDQDDPKAVMKKLDGIMQVLTAQFRISFNRLSQLY